jgi:phage shock protein E
MSARGQRGAVNKNVLVVVAVGVLLAAAAIWVSTSGSGGPGSVTAIGNEELRELVGEGARLVDVRTPAEFEAGHIDGAELAPVASVLSEAEGWDADQPVVVYCATGARSASVAQSLADMGFEVHDLVAGLVAWDGELVTPAGSEEPEATDGTTEPAGQEGDPSTEDDPAAGDDADEPADDADQDVSAPDEPADDGAALPTLIEFYTDT